MRLFDVIKTLTVFILKTNYDQSRQDTSMARKYMNRFAIEEDDQFEIHVKDHTDKRYNEIGQEEIYNAAEEVILKAQQGSGYYGL